MTSLRDYQQTAIDRLRSSVGSGHRRIVMQAPTGAGKSIMAAEIVMSALRKHRSVYFVVPAVDLIDQTVAMFEAHGVPAEEIGVIQAKHPRTKAVARVQIASVQSLMRRDLMLYDLVIVDECHEVYKFVVEWMNRVEFLRTPFIGLSATPWTKGLGQIYQDLIIVSTTEELIAAGYLSRFKVFAPSHPDLGKVTTVAGDYHVGQLSTAMSTGNLVADVVETWRAKAENRPTFVFAVDRAHASLLQSQFEECGIPTGYIDFKTPREERAEIRRQFHNGEIKIVCNVECLTTGVDWDVRCISLARPTKSEMLYVQMIGRGLRIAPGKDHCLILDHSDTTERLGFVTDIHHEKLSMAKPKDAAEAEEPEKPLPKPCPSCSFMRPPRVAVCPHCGFAPNKRSGVQYEEGELLELEESPARKRNKGVRGELQKLRPEVLYGALKLIAMRRGYNPRWATAQYHTIMQRWPSDETKRAEPCEAPPLLMSWLKAEQIRYAKGKGKSERVAA
jgi:DNA repair protein RadD